MLPNFNELLPQLSNESRVWLYLAERKLDDTEAHFVSEKIDLFVQNWTAHNKKLTADGTIIFQQYIVLGVDEKIEAASGCSIDGSVRLIKSLQQELGIDFFNRLKVLAFLENQWQTKNYFEVQEDKLPYLNPTIQTLGELRTNWIQNQPVVTL
jgi:hypothetical protein